MVIKTLFISMFSVLLCSCSTQKFIEIKDSGATSYKNDIELSEIIKNKFTFLENGRESKYQISLFGMYGSTSVSLTIRKRVVTMNDYYNRNTGYSSENPEFHEFMERLRAVMQKHGTSVQIGEPHRIIDILGTL